MQSFRPFAPTIRFQMKTKVDLKTKLRSIRNNSLKPHFKKSVLEHVSENRYLSPSASSKPGKWQPFVVPAIEPMQAITKRGVRYITVMSSAQLLKTDLLLNAIFYFMSHDPASVILAQPIEKLAEAFSKDRIDPLISDNKILSSGIKNKRERDSENNLLLKKFGNGASLSIVSASSVSDLASRSARVVLMDELDRYKDLGTEGDPEKLLNERTNTYSHNFLNMAVSTPTNDKASRIERRFNQSSKHYFHAVCVHCQAPQKLIWGQVRWDKDKPETAAYECSSCRVLWTEADRANAVKAGYYIAENPHITSHLGYHVNAIASPWQKLEALVKKFIDCGDDQNKLRTFVNLSLAETWKPKVDVPEWNRLYERRENYPSEIIPNNKILFITCAADVQKNRIEAAVYGWTRKKEKYLIEAIVFSGATETDAPWDELEKLIQKEYPIANSVVKMPISMTCVDSGYLTTKVYEWVSKFNPTKVRAVDGIESLKTHFSMSKQIQPSFNGFKTPYTHYLYSVGVNLLKEFIYSNLRLNSPVDDEEFPNDFIHINEQDAEFFKQLTSEALVQKKNKYEWTKTRERNEQLDLIVYNQAAAFMYGISKFTPVEWDFLEKRISEPTALEESQRPKIIEHKNHSTKPKQSPWKHQVLQNKYRR